MQLDWLEKLLCIQKRSFNASGREGTCGMLTFLVSPRLGIRAAELLYLQTVG